MSYFSYVHPSSWLPRLLLAASLAASGVFVVSNAFAADDAGKMARGKTLFTTATPACALCHTLKDAGAEGAVGPVLDELKPDANRVSKALRDGLGAMPSFKATLSEADIAALAYYVARATGAEK
ncbi:MAG: cytochrome c [Candidatus Saccharibacteria bacterium]|nr:cytochrome c [Rhodoferax sp.]